jgi:hypothetical protein
MTDSGAQVKVTARELLDRGAWMRACEMTGLSEWAVNEGRMDASDTVTLTLAQAVELGLLNPLPEPPAGPTESRAVCKDCGRSLYLFAGRWFAIDGGCRETGSPYHSPPEADEPPVSVAQAIASAIEEAGISDWDTDPDGKMIEIYVSQIAPIVERVLREGGQS